MSPVAGKRSKDRSNVVMPFGEPDGQRSEIDDDFIHFEFRDGWGGIATEGGDLSARLLVGRKGSGKTIYLRRLRAHVSREGGNYTDDVQYEPPDTQTVLDFARFFPTNSQIEWWAKLWNRCILRCLASHLTAGEISSGVHPRWLDRLSQFTQASRAKLLREFAAPVSIYRQFDEIVNGFHNRNSVVEYLQNPYWSDLESILAEVVRESPPIFFFLDALDEHFERSPRWWLKCQEGLFFQAVMLSRSKQWNRLHLAVSLRDIVHASMMRSEHRSRFTGAGNIRLLNWDYNSIDRFLTRKLQTLDRRFFAREVRGSKSCADWLGVSTVENVGRKVMEPVQQYLLRHTRLLPRDLVILGNRLCGIVGRSKTGSVDMQEEIRRNVHEAASVFGREQLRICANEIVSSYIPRGFEGHDTVSGSDDFTSAIAMQLQELVRMIGTDRFPRTVIDRFDAGAREQFDCDVFSLLWRNSLIGYVEGSGEQERFIFYHHDSLNNFDLPVGAKEYVFHPIVTDATGIPSSGSNPVVPYA